MKILFVSIISIFAFVNLLKAQRQNDFQVITINRTVKEHKDTLDLSTPLKSFVSFKYLKSKGKEALYRDVNSYKIKALFPDKNTPDKSTDELKKESLLNTKINEILIYNDSVAGVISDYQPPLQIVTYLTFENGQWLNAGEGLGNNKKDAHLQFKENAPKHLENIHRIKVLQHTRCTSNELLNYLDKRGETPEQYIVNKLTKHKLVIYGELHRRKASWALMNRVAESRKFQKEVGTVFMELSSDKQSLLDAFFLSDTLNSDIILTIFRNIQVNGWYDKGMYEYLMKLWEINHNLPKKKKIRVIAVDEPRPFDSFQTYDELKKHFQNTLERNDQMAKIILETINAAKDKRNYLFIVGMGHAYKSTLNDIAIGSQANKMRPTVASQLNNTLSDNEVFTIMQHVPIGNNHGIIFGEVRNGIFDKAFFSYGNKPVAFDLEDSPFGKEPFDALYEVSYNKNIRNYEDNYDGYIFLGSLDTEPSEYLFNDIIDETYLAELERRAKMLNTTVERWFGVDNTTVKDLKSKIQFKPNEKRWKK